MTDLQIHVDPHPLLDLGAFCTVLPRPLGQMRSPQWLLDRLRPGAPAPRLADDATREAVRRLLRHGGYKPSGRGKPASEFLLRAAASPEGVPSINLVVDACNAVSLASGLPISVVDLDRATPPLRVGIAADDASYVFNPSGQEIRLAGLVCLHDAEGPCANAVKDAQRTKTSGDTTRTLSLVWGTRELPEVRAEIEAWYRSLLEQAGATTSPVALAH